MMRHSALITGRRTWVIPTAIINRSDATKMEAAMIHELASEEGEDQVDEVREEEKEEDSESVLVIRAQGNSVNNRRNDERQGNRRNFDGNHQSNHRGAPKPNPFARPEKPLPVPQQDDGLEQQALESDNDSGNEQLESNDEAQESTIKSNEEEKSISSNES